METTDYASYDLALKLKACGFNWLCTTFYRDLDHELMEGGEMNWNNGVDYSAPTLWQAQKWLREKKKIDILVYNCACGYIWEVSKAKDGTGLILFDEKGDDESSGCWTSYEAALSAGISAALELIKKGG